MPAVLLLGLLWSAPAAAETPFAGLWQEPMTTTSRNDRAIWLAWYPQGVAESGQWETSSFLRFGCRISLPEQEDRIPSTDLRVTLYIERGEDEPSVASWISPLYWIRGLSGKEYELVDIYVSIDQNARQTPSFRAGKDSALFSWP